MHVKICGITTPPDAVMAAQAGADAIGINLVGGPRRVDLATADEIVTVLPPMVTPVALVNIVAGDISADQLEWLGTRWVSHIQLYGEIDSRAVQTMARDGFRPMFVCRVKGPDFADGVNALLDACGTDRPAAIVLDAYDQSKAGGTGEPFNWTWVQQAAEADRMQKWPSIILAGGLTPDNVAAAIQAIGPWAVDVSTGVESAPGKKDAAKVAAFTKNAKSRQR